MPTAGQWHHCALIRGWGDDDDTFAVVFNGGSGVEDLTMTDSDPVGYTFPDFSGPLEFGVGRYFNVEDGGCLYATEACHVEIESSNIYFDEIRVTKGRARWTAPFQESLLTEQDLSGSDLELDYRPWRYPTQLGIDAPSDPVTLADSAVAGNPDGTYSYVCTFVNNDGFESNKSAAATIVVATNKVTVSDIPLSTDPQVIARRLYRTLDGGTLYRLVVEITDNHTVSYTDDTADASLGVFLHDDTHDVPVAAIDCCEHLAQLFLLQSPNKVWWCNAFNEWEYFASDNYEPFGSPPTAATGMKIMSFGEYLAVMLDTEIWHLEGSSDIDYKKKKSLANRGPVHTRATAHRGDVLYFLDGAGVFMYDQVRDIEVTRKVLSLFRPEWEDSDRIDIASRAVSRMAYLDGELIVLYPATGYSANNRMLRYNILTDAFDLDDSVEFTDVVSDPKGKKFYVCEGKFIYELYSGNYRGDGASSIYCTLQTKDYAMEEEMGGVHVMKEMEWIAVDLDTDGTCTIRIYLDGSLADYWNIVAGARQVYRKRVDIAQKFYRLSIGMYLSSTSKFYGFSTEVNPSEGI
jgi:hypothetical protein